MNQFHFYWLALAAYVLSAVGYIGGFFFTAPRWQKTGGRLAAAGLALHATSLLIRWRAVGHGPYISTYEILNSDVWIAVLFFLLFQWRRRAFSHLGTLVMPFAFVMMGFALLGTPEAKELTPTLRSAWLVVHILFAKLTVASLIVAAALAVFYLRKRGRPETGSNLLSKLPSPAVLDDYSYRLMAFGFVALTLMIITGSIWANNSWGTYWDWDPAETWSLVVWFVYGLYLHGRITYRWQGRVASWYAIAALLFSILAFFVLPYFVKGQHSEYMVG